MRDKKRQLIEAALRCFAQKGYHATSIQDIVAAAGSAKGSLYAYFDSKEDVLLAALKYVFDQVMQSFGAVAREDNGDSRQRLVHLLKLHYSIHVEHSEFIMALMEERAFQLNEDLEAFLPKVERMTFRVYRRPLLDLYGPDVAPYLYDLLLDIHSLILQWTKLLVADKLALDIGKLAEMTADRVDDMASGMMRAGKPPLLDERMAERLSYLSDDERRYSIWAGELAKIRQSLEERELAPEAWDELRSYLLILEKEVSAERPDDRMVQAFVERLLRYEVPEVNVLLRRLQKYGTHDG